MSASLCMVRRSIVVVGIASLCSVADADKVDDYIPEQMKKQQIPGLSLAVVRGGKVVKAKGYGLANIELRVAATPRTVYQIQSITKPFTAMAVMKLVEEGKIRLDAPVGSYLKGTPVNWKEITVRHLLTHTSGIKDFINEPEPTANPRLDLTDEEILKSVAARPLNFTPGEFHAYSNTNYHLLGMIIHTTSGKPYGEFLREQVFEPLGMKDTRIFSASEIIPNRAAGHVSQNGNVRNGGYVAPSILAYAGGGICSTVLDMAKWDAALYGERLLQRSSLEQIATPATLRNGKPTSYGFGWYVGTINGHRNLAHGGGRMTGFSSSILRFVEDRLTVIVLANQADADPVKIARGVVGHYLPEVAPPVYRPIVDREPEVTARVREFFVKAAEGKLDESLFTPQYWAEIAPQKDSLREGIGPLQSLVLVEHKQDGANRQYRYRITLGRSAFLVLFTITPENRIAGMFHERD